MSKNETSKLELETAQRLKASESIETLTWSSAASLFKRQTGIKSVMPDGSYAVDERNGDLTLFNPNRMKRPHDNVSLKGTRSLAKDCMICRGQTTSILDIALLEEGFTFINENLYPMLYPLHETAGGPGTDGAALGLHFLQWTSSYHNKDWPELSSRDRLIVLSRLAALEERLLTLPNFPLQKGERSHVSIIKNVGLRVGGSLSHGHQQIGLSNVLPRRVKEHQDFVKNTGLTFSEHMIRENPACLTVSNLSEGKLFVPYYMRRPYDLLFCVTDTKAGRLSTLSQRALSDIGEALALGSTLITKALLLLEREIAYNVIFHTGPGTGIYLEFLPHTQENGGFEQMGMNVCQESPFTAARVLREFL